MQDLLTLAATVTLYSTIAFIVVGYPLYVWQRTAPIPASEFLTKEELAEEGNAVTVEPTSLPELFAAVDTIMDNPIYAADALATPVKRRRKVSTPPTQEVIPSQLKKRGRSRKEVAA